MDKVKRYWWKTPATIRKPLVLIVGSIFVLAAAATGWLPGPGGIPLFLVGIAILATEFVWAEKFRDFILNIVFAIGRWWRAHKIVGTIVFALCAACSLALSIFLYRQTH